jgi:phosphoribosyl 1,2-cyclic phosphodiesterase
MALSIASLNSGSNGNCYYVGNQREAVLIDAGISARETVIRMRRLGLSMKLVKAIFITHEHGDHIKGVRSLVKKFRVPVYITNDTLREGRLKIKDEFVRNFSPYQPIAIGNLSVTAFPKFHDACDPHSFIVSSNYINVGVFTDIGYPCKHVIKHFRQCHAAFLESNYDEEMLEKGSYSYHLKNRIRGGNGHLSNTQAFEIFQKYRPAFMSHLFLSHLSENNNTSTIVENLFSGVAGNTKIIIASRHEESDLYHLSVKPGYAVRALRTKITRPNFQLSLFQ